MMTVAAGGVEGFLGRQRRYPERRARLRGRARQRGDILETVDIAVGADLLAFE